MQMHRLIVLCFLFTSTAAAAAAAADDDDPNHISINCGEAAPVTALTGRRWSGDAAPEGSSTASTVKGDLIAAVDAVPYKTARVSRSRFSYSFQISPGQKFIRLHFNPVSYHGFESLNDFFTVEAGPFTLLANFSAFITARALSVNVVAKEFCIIVQENQPLNIVFSPETSRSKYNYAFINGIEIISVPSTISYCHGGDNGIHVLGQKSVIYVDNTTVLERIYHQNMKSGSVLDDIGGMFGMWASNLENFPNKASNLSWRVSVDVGFRYLVRIHLSEVGLKMDFTLLIDNMIALTSADVLQKGGNQSILWYNYMVMVEGHKREGKRRISVSLNSQHEFLDKHGPIEGFEVFKLSNHDRSLASPNPLPVRGDSPLRSNQTLLYFLLGRRNAIVTIVFTAICLVNIIVHLLNSMWVADKPDIAEEESKPSARAKRLCRRFSLAEIQSATQNFHEGFVIGKGGFGKVDSQFLHLHHYHLSYYIFQAMKILNQNCMQMHRLIILCFLFTFKAAAAAAAAADDPNHIFINCGGAAPATALTGRQWLRDAAPEGSSTTATVKGELITVVDPVPYKTARISGSQFSYSFQMSPGQKFIRLHFNPVPYHGFESFNDLFTVEAGPFTLLANFSASITARALAVNTFIKEFCIVLQENQPLNIVFSPETSFHSKYNYAFINGIEIISVPSTISYCHGGDSGVRVLGKNYVIHLENTTALEVVHRQDIKRGFLSSDNDRDGIGLWENKAYNRSWRVSVDVGFRYLVRLHLCEVGLKMDFRLLVSNMIALTSADMPKQRGDQTNLWYNNYMVMVEGHKREGKRLITICLHSPHEFLNRRGPLEGFEVLKLSNPDLSLASPNPLPPRVDSPSQTIRTRLQSLLGLKNVATVVFTTLCLVKITTLLLHKMWGPDFSKEQNLPSARARRLCRHFTLAEIRSATQNFHVEFLLGRGGFGKVYKGLLDNGRDVVAIKRSKPDSNQGEKQFWTEVEMLSELRHVNLVSLIGYCMEQQEMILVYEYMPRGTLADHLYKLSRKSNPFYPLSWKQRLKICIGAGRALDYLHTGHGIIHRDVKASNILLDEKFVAKVSDFGLAKTGICSESQSQDSTNLKGTIGYIDPNYFRTRKITKNSDTYSFGVVLLEVLCGRPAVEPWYGEDKYGLTTWAIDNISKGQVDDIVAPSLRGEISIDSLKTFVKVAETCLHEEPKKRPAMTHTVIELELALQQQEKAESLPLKEHMNFLEPNENINVVKNLSPSLTGKILPPQPNLRIFTFSELKTATRNFRSDYVLGEGGSGKVYKGSLREKASGKNGSGTLIAVKRMNPESEQGFQEWQSNVNFLGRLSHPNLVRLLGYSLEDKELLLVYEYMTKGSLENHLFGRGASVRPLPWDIRLKVLIGAAHGLAFLHASDKNIIFRDFKASNILLDGSYHAKISDFGLAKMGPTASKSHVSTRVMGTYGYAAPEYVAKGHLYVESDVYGFGVLLVEMLTGLRSLDTYRPSGQHYLAEWIKPHLSDWKKLEKMIDVRLEGLFPFKSAFQIAQLALTCLEAEPQNRPSMQEAVETLERIGSSSERPFSQSVSFPSTPRPILAIWRPESRLKKCGPLFF